MEELGKKKEESKLYNDSQTIIHLNKNLAFHSITKHIKIKYHFIFLIEDVSLKICKIHTSQNPIDMFTNVVTREKLIYCSNSIGLME